MFFVFKQDDTSADAEYIFNINTTAQQYVAVYCDTNVIYTHISDNLGNISS